ncbi:MAG TPA: EAL domain-containing protein [Anaeromyxobacteraceae bacterium]|nr:EAL domain-containing protein [Anaeromyxobacteraceae bacterium]
MKWLIGRQPILNPQERVSGYELLFRTPLAQQAKIDDPSYATASVILGVLSGFGVQQILGGHRGFINVDREFLFSDAIELMPREQTVLEILETVEPSDAVVERCRHLASAGFHLALDDHQFDPAFERLYRLVEIVKVDLILSPVDKLAEAIAQLRPYPIKLLAEKVETREQFRRCLDLGFHYFQGYYFARPAVLERRRVIESSGTLLKILRLLAQDADIRELELAFREGPDLTYRLLVLVNSVAFGFRERIASVRHAISILGRQQMRRWLQLALFASADQRGLDNPLLDAAAVRATFMERLACSLPDHRQGGDRPEQAFMVGVLSLLDALYDVSMAELVRVLNLSEEVSAALLERGGVLGSLLAIVERMERLETEEAWALLKGLGITQEQVSEAQWRAFAWRST